MREFGPPIDAAFDRRIRDALSALYARIPVKREVLGAALAMDDAEMLVLTEADLKFVDGVQRYRLSRTEPEARPPFEWLMEISSDVGESEYFKHYLIREDDIVLAQRKVLTVIDNIEAQVVLDDIAAVQAELDADPESDSVK